MTNNPKSTASNSSIAKARWSILQKAILGSIPSQRNVLKTASIHSFPGFPLLNTTSIQNANDDHDYMERLCTLLVPAFVCHSVEEFLTYLEERMAVIKLAMECLAVNHWNTIRITLQSSDHVTITREALNECKQRGTITTLTESPTFLCKILREESLPSRFECKEYTIPSTSIRIRTREKIHKNQKMNLHTLMSQSYHQGIDNTGNIRVWDTEIILTYCLFQPCSFIKLDNILSLADEGGRLRVIELGCGMAGIAGLALACLDTSTFSSTPITMDVTLTDGHPDAIQNNEINTSLTSALFPSLEIQSHLLLWNHGPKGTEECNRLTKNDTKSFQLCLVSDCLHFVEYHVHLMATIGRLLSIGGICILMQPKRGNSLQLFMDLICFAKDLFHLEVFEEYNDEVTELHQKFCTMRDDYIPDKHYPIVLVLKKQREYREDLDTVRALEFKDKREVAGIQNVLT